MRAGFRRVLVPRAATALLLSAGTAQAASFAERLHHDWFAPRAAAFAQSAAAIAPALQSLCAATPARSSAALDGARQSWTIGLRDWETLAGVAIGPVLERRSQRAIDFTPTRPRMIEKAIKAAPKSPADMELIGTPAKGLPALEWLLWVKPVQPGSAACAYAVQVALEIDREAAALAGTKILASDDQALLSELVNQWVGGIERLRWPGMEMPLRVSLTATPPTVPDYPRRDSAAAALAWAAQWNALRALALDGDASLRGVLATRGKGAVAEALAVAVADADSALRGLDAADGTRVLAAAKVLAGLKHQVESDVAPALGVGIGFSDADGD